MTRYHITWRVALLYLALTLVFTYPVWVHPATRLMWMGGDTRLFVWTLSWDTYAFTHHPLSIFDANIFYPARYTLAYSENLIGSAFIAAPVIWLTGNPILAINFVVLLSCVLCGIGAYVLARRVGLGPLGAAIAGIIFAFAPPRLLRIGQVHLFTVQWVPFGLACLHAYLDEGRRTDLRLAIGLFSLQALTSGHGAVFLLLSMVLLLAYRLALGEKVELGRRLRDVGIAGFLLLLPTVLILVPYRLVQVEMGLVRDLVDWTLSGASFLSSPSYVHQFLLSLVPSLRINEQAQADLFPGFLPILLAAVACLPRLRKRRGAVGLAEGTSRSEWWWRRTAATLEVISALSLGAAVFVVLSGPVRLKLGDLRLLMVRHAARPFLLFVCTAAGRLMLAWRVPLVPIRRLRPVWNGALALPHRAVAGLRGFAPALRRNAVVFYAIVTTVALLLASPPPLGLWPHVYWLPGLNFIRVPARFTILALLGLAVLAGRGADRLSVRLAPSRRWVFAVVLGAALCGELLAAPLDPREYAPEIPSIDRWLATRPKPFYVAEVPVGDPDNGDRESVLMLHSMAHWQKTVHAFSGFLPPKTERLYEQMGTFPDEASLRSLAHIGITYIVAHPDLYPPGEWPVVQARIREFSNWLTLEHEDESGAVYALHDPAHGGAGGRSNVR